MVNSIHMIKVMVEVRNMHRNTLKNIANLFYYSLITKLYARCSINLFEVTK